MIREKLLKPEKKTDEGANQSYDLMRSSQLIHSAYQLLDEKTINEGVLCVNY